MDKEKAHVPSTMTVDMFCTIVLSVCARSGYIHVKKIVLVPREGAFVQTRNHDFQVSYRTNTVPDSSKLSLSIHRSNRRENNQIQRNMICVYSP